MEPVRKGRCGFSHWCRRHYGGLGALSRKPVSADLPSAYLLYLFYFCFVYEE